VSPGAEVRQALDEIIRLKHEVARLEAQLVHDHDKAEARIDEAEARSYRDHRIAEELQGILAKRSAIGAASGIISEQEDVDVIEAFGILRARARKSRRSLGDYSAGVVATHNKAVGPPRRVPPQPAPNVATDAAGHDACTVCGGAHRDDAGYPCTTFHELVGFWDGLTLNGVVVQ